MLTYLGEEQYPLILLFALLNNALERHDLAAFQESFRLKGELVYLGIFGIQAEPVDLGVAHHLLYQRLLP